MVRLVPGMVVLAGCGRLSFDVLPPDAADGTDRPNRVFITKAKQSGSFGGLAVADDTCATEARDAGLPGTFIAFLATSSAPEPRTRLAGSNGWVLPDGTPVGSSVEDMLDGFAVFNPVAMEADGTPISATGESTWTGTSSYGVIDPTRTCTDWTSNANAQLGHGNNVRNASWAGGAAVACDTLRRLLCFETGHVAPVAPVRVEGRLAFLTAGKRTTAIDRPGADMLCNTEATAAGFPGMYLAALTTSTEAIASRFTIDARPIIGVDGTYAADGATFFTTSTLVSFIHQTSDGAYIRENFFTGVVTDPTMTATAAQTCQNWSSISAGGTAQTGEPEHTIGTQFWTALGNTCDAKLHFLCVQR